MALECITVETAPNPGAAVIWLHGLGADGHDFVPIVDQMDLASLGGVRFVFPHAPKIPVTINGGMVMRAWYDITAMNIVGREDAPGMHRSQAQILELIDQQKAAGIPARRIVLAGFSQGCAMTLLTGLRYPERLAGLLCLSGYLPLATQTAAQRNPANNDVPIFLAHGTYDPVVPIAAALMARTTMAALGYTLQWHDYPMQHAVCAEEIDDVARWFGEVLGA
jgi:phospholipase/carboxylesterase